jgi:hypothetical protein
MGHASAVGLTDLFCSEEDVKTTWQLLKLIAHSHTPARKSQNQCRWIVAVVTQLIGQHPACFFAITEHHTAASLDLGGWGKTLLQESRAKQAEVEVERRPAFLHISLGLSLNLPITLAAFLSLLLGR